MYIFDINTGKQFKKPIKLEFKAFSMYVNSKTKSIYFGADKGLFYLKSI